MKKKPLRPNLFWPVTPGREIYLLDTEFDTIDDEVIQDDPHIRAARRLNKTRCHVDRDEDE